MKNFCKNLVVMHVNRDGGKESATLVKDFKVNAYPTLLMIKPNGEVLQRVEGGLEKPEHFLGKWVNEFWNKYADAANAKPQDAKAMAENLCPLLAWYPDTEMGKRAADALKQASQNPDFRTIYDGLAKKGERENLWAKADAQMKLGKKKEATETYRKLATDFPDDKEGKDAAAILKKMGVKLDAPPAK
ncbi:MAG: hypothetical protein IT452_00980 [Planctomycetia bacterium]|nr:hypothetical protein [Planctomycetia bacterium]